MNKYALVGLSVAGGILSALAWTSWCSGLILLIAFVPFFLIENYLFENPNKFTPNAFFIFILPGFVIFSIISLSLDESGQHYGSNLCYNGIIILNGLHYMDGSYYPAQGW